MDTRPTVGAGPLAYLDLARRAMGATDPLQKLLMLGLALVTAVVAFGLYRIMNEPEARPRTAAPFDLPEDRPSSSARGDGVSSLDFAPRARFYEPSAAPPEEPAPPPPAARPAPPPAPQGPQEGFTATAPGPPPRLVPSKLPGASGGFAAGTVVSKEAKAAARQAGEEPEAASAPPPGKQARTMRSRTTVSSSQVSDPMEAFNLQKHREYGLGDMNKMTELGKSLMQSGKTPTSADVMKDPKTKELLNSLGVNPAVLGAQPGYEKK